MPVSKIVPVITAACLFLVFACALKPIPPEAMLDTPLHHVSNGNKLLKNGKIDAALYEFSRAEELDPKFAPALAGQGLVSAYRGDFKSGLERMKTARKHALTDDQKTDVHIGFMRIYLMGKDRIDKDWLGRIETEFAKAKQSGPGRPAPYFYMGLAYKAALRFDEAAGQFEKVFEIDTRFVQAAEREYALIQKTKHAKP